MDLLASWIRYQTDMDSGSELWTRELGFGTVLLSEA